MKKFPRGLALACALLAAGASRADGLFLAPGQTLTILDRADPQVRVVLRAPADAPLDLGAILVAGPDDTVHSIVTRIQVNPAAGLKQEEDGTLALSGAAPASAPMLRSGVLFRSGARFVYQPVQPAAPGRAPSPGASAPRGQMIVFKLGGSSAEAQRDIASCRRYADTAVAAGYSRGERIELHNAALLSCLRGFGYEVHTPRG